VNTCSPNDGTIAHRILAGRNPTSRLGSISVLMMIAVMTLNAALTARILVCQSAFHDTEKDSIRLGVSRSRT